MKKRFSTLSLLVTVVATLFFASCSGSKSQGDYVNVIPKNSITVFSCNVGDLVNKSEILDNQLVTSLLLVQAQRSLQDAAYDKLELILKDLNESGLDVTAPAYIAMQQNEDNSQTTIFVAKVSNEDKLNETFDLISKSNSNFTPFKEGNNFKYSCFDGLYIGYNSTAFVVLPMPYGKDEEVGLAKLNNLFAQNKENSMSSTGQFQKMIEMSGDIKLLAGNGCLDIIGEEQKALIYKMMPEGVTEKDEFAFLLGVSFNKGELVVEAAKYTDSDILDKYIDENNCLQHNKGTFLANIPANALGVMSIGFDGSKAASAIKDNPMLDKALDENRQAKTMITQASRFLPDFVGDITVALTGIGEGRYSAYPIFVAMVELDNTKAIASLLNSLPLLLGDALETLSPRNYAIDGSMMRGAMGKAIYFGYSDNSIYVSNDVRYAGDANYNAEPAMANDAFASEMKSSYVAATADIQKITKSDLMSSRSLKAAKAILENFEKAELVCDQSLKLKLYFENKDANALKQISEIIISSNVR